MFLNSERNIQQISEIYSEREWVKCLHRSRYHMSGIQCHQMYTLAIDQTVSNVTNTTTRARNSNEFGPVTDIS